MCSSTRSDDFSFRYPYLRFKGGAGMTDKVGGVEKGDSSKNAGVYNHRPLVRKKKGSQLIGFQAVPSWIIATANQPIVFVKPT
jgi:hypothetical protein